MPSTSNPPTPPEGVTFGDPEPTQTNVPEGVTFGDPTTPPSQYSADTLAGNLRASGEEVKGLVKGAAHTAAGLLDIAGSPTGSFLIPGTSLIRPQLHDTAKWIRAHTQINNPYQQTGNIAETVAEFMALPEMDAETMATKVPGVAEYFGQGAKLAKYLSENPKALTLMRVGLNAMRSGVEQGAQTAAKTGGDIKQTAEAAGIGAAAGGATSAVGEAWRAGRAALSDAAMARMAPPPRPLAGEAFPTTAGGKLNVPEGGERAATQQFEAAGQNIGQKAVKNSLERSNAARPVGRGTPPNPERMLPAEASPTSTGATPEDLDRFTVEGTPPRETVTQPSQEGSRIYGLTREEPNPDYQPLTDERGVPTEAGMAARATKGAAPARSYTGEPTRTVPNWQEIPPPTGGGDVLRHGGGPMILTADGQATTIENARARLNNYEDMMNDPEIGPRAKGAIQDAHADLSAQVDRYDNYAAEQARLFREAGQARTGMYEDYAASEPNFPEHDVNAAMQNTTGIQSAGQNLMDAHRPFFKEADRLTNGEFGLLSKRAKGLTRLIRNPEIASTDRLARLDDLQEVNDQIDDLFQQHRTKFTPQEWSTARNGYRDGAVMNELGSFLEGHMGGITPEEAARRPNLAQGRLFSPSEGFNKGLQKIYDKHSDVLERTIGRDSMDDLKELGQLYKDPETTKATESLRDSIGSSIKRHFHGLRAVAAEGVGAGLAAHYMGMGAHAIAGSAISAPVVAGTITGTRRYVLDRMASDPDFARKFIYAVKNGVPPRQAAPVLASRIISTLAKPTPEADKTPAEKEKK